ncbi:MAG: hypothetical protein ACLFSM_02035 [Thermoplasmata archaeon]
MVCKKLPSLVIISIMITSSLTVFGSQLGRTEEGGEGPYDRFWSDP